MAVLSLLGLALVVGSPIDAAVYAQAFSGRGLPGRREGAGTRGACLVGSSTQVPTDGTIVTKEQASPDLVAIIPESNIAATLTEYPTFFWYVPGSSLKMGRFTLYDGYRTGRKKVYETRLSLDGTPGVISFKLPSDGTVPPLQLNRIYSWTFRVFCDPLDRSGDLQVEGFVQRVRPSAELEARLKRSTDRERPTIYAASGIWHEMLTSLVELRRVNPSDRSLQADWETLMRTIKLDALSTQPVVSCCRVQDQASRQQ